MIAQKSPKSAIVKELFVANGQHVDAGTEILRLNAEEEEMELIKIDSQKAIISAQRINVVDPARSARLQAMDRMISSSYAAAQSMAAEITGQEEQILVGQATKAQVIEYRKQLLQSRLKNIKIKIERDGFLVNSDASAKHLDIVLLLLEKERDHFRQAITRLRILAPTSGLIELMVGKGSPCKMGFTLFTIS